MSKKQNDFRFDIPIPVILIALIFSFPIGVVLAVLRFASSSGGDKNENSMDNQKLSENGLKDGEIQKNTFAKRGEKGAAGTKKSAEKEKSKAKRSAPTVISAICTIVFFVIGILGILSSFSDGTDKILGNLIEVIPFMTVSGISYLFSLFFRDRDNRFNRIRAVIGNKDSFYLPKLASVSGQSIKKVRRDVQRLIAKGEFGNEAYIDLGTDNFMRFADAKPDFAEGFDFRPLYDERIFGKSKSDSAGGAAENEKTDPNEKSDKDSFRSIILEIRRLNDEIHDFAVSERIYRIEEYTQYIFDYVTEHPETMPKIRTFMNYYLPTTLKLLESYRRIEHMGVTGENMKTSKEKIESILDLLVDGYKQQMDNLFQNESIDISSDISVLETMMMKDGLSGNKTFGSSFDKDFGGAAAMEKPENE